MLDLLIHNASLPDGRKNMSVAVQDGKMTTTAAGRALKHTPTPGTCP